MSINFKVKGIGSANIAFSDGAITANDGSGSNVLTSSLGLRINTLASSGVTEIEAPTQIIRTPEPAKILPATPALSVPTYPEVEKWYNVSSPYTVSWVLPGDITRVATLIDQKTLTNPTKSEGLFESKKFAPLPDGTWYLHVRFGNALGWGKTATRAIQIDTMPPSAFEIDSKDGLATDNPTPEISYHAVDSLSGMDKYAIRVDGQNVGETTEEMYTFTPLTPGTKTISVVAYDKAGNGSIANMNIEIKPIPSPKISTISKKLYVGEGAVSIVGSSAVDTIVQVTLINKEGGIVVDTQEAAVDAQGLWSIAFNQLLKRGDYYVEAVARDNRGATSLPAISDPFTLYNAPAITIYGIDLTETTLIALLSAVFIGVLGAGWFLFRLGTAQRRRKSVIAQRDVNNVLMSIEKETEKVLEVYNSKKMDVSSKKAELNLLLERMRANISRVKDYVIADIKDIED